MARLEDLTPGAVVKGVLADALVTVVSGAWHGDAVLEITYKDPQGNVGNELIYRDREPSLEIAESGLPFSFDGDGELFRLVSEAYRIHLAYLFDPMLAVHTSMVEPLPHQITAVYGEMLKRQPLRFLLADDPGAGKTIMAGLLIKELLIRGDVERCMVVCPGSLVEQWQDELKEKFDLDFTMLTTDNVEATSGNWFDENHRVICRLDKLARNDDLKEKLKRSADWDLVICDEAHKMSASFFGQEVKFTKRHQLGQLLSKNTRNFLLMTATPHNGKETDFQLFLSLIDGDRFEGRFRDGVHVTDASDIMRRMVKEDLVRFDNTPLFPERRAYTINYKLSDPEAQLYTAVTGYVREEFNRVERLEEGRKGTVGFALTILQRRLASSPAAIHESLKRRKARLEARLREAELLKRGESLQQPEWLRNIKLEDQEDIDDFEEAPDSEIEDLEDQLVDQASAARSIPELQAEIAILAQLESLAEKVRRSNADRKWEELSRILQDNPEMLDDEGHRRKLVIFTEHKDTLEYLAEKIGALIGRPEAVVTIHGGLAREVRRNAQESFTNDKTVEILVATDAAGEGINLQRAHLMVNYDLPWNPNRLEQRFGRIHRIGQKEVCHLWNLVASETREGEVFLRLCQKLEEESKAFKGRIFDVLGKAFSETPLRQLLMDAIRYGDQPEVRARLTQTVETALDKDHLAGLIDQHALTHEAMDANQVQKIREDMQRAEAQRLQPHYVAAFFVEAFQRLGGTIHKREEGRHEIKHVPSLIRSRDRAIGVGRAVLPRYQRVTFHKELISMEGRPMAAFISPGHPILDCTIDVLLEQHRDLLKRGAVLIDEERPGREAPSPLLPRARHSRWSGPPLWGPTGGVTKARVRGDRRGRAGDGSRCGAVSGLPPCRGRRAGRSGDVS